MYFSKLEISGIKNIESESVDLEPVTVVTGQNGSGKTAILEALRLAVTGRAEVGGTGQKIGLIMSSPDSSKVTIHDDYGQQYTFSIYCRGENKYSTSHVKRACDDPQGSLPVTVDDFLSLSAEQKFRLIGGDNLSENTRQTEAVKDEIRYLKERLERPGPATPEHYDGMPVAKLNDELADISLALSRHREACAEQYSRPLLLKRLDELERALKSVNREIESVDDLLKKADKKASELLALEQEQIEKNHRPEVVAGCRTIQDVIEVMESRSSALIEWCEKNGLELSVNISSPNPDAELPPCVLFGNGFQSLATEALENQKELERRYDELVDKERALEAELQAFEVKDESKDDLIDEEEYERLVMRHEELQGLQRKAQAWSEYERVCGNDQVERSMAAKELGECEDKLSSLIAERVELTRSIKGPIEEKANLMASRAGMPPLDIVLSSTPKTSSLTAVSNGIDLSAMAKSFKLFYGICILNAIQELSGFKCPILVAQCAEMDLDMFNATIVAAKGCRTVGNLILEHHLIPTKACHLIVRGNQNAN